MRNKITSLPRNVFNWSGNITDEVMPVWMQEAIKAVMLPVAGILFFLLIWGTVAQNIDTSLGKFPGPTQAFEQFQSLMTEHNNERKREVAFYQRQEDRNLERLAQDPNYVMRIRDYTGKPTFIDQTFTSLITVLTGFILASIIAIPFGIMIGLSK
ncbi:MAG: nitrate/nitrite transport system permease protein, partial [Pseudohongiellaceae bacterium]